MKVSVIVPIYKGKKYITQMIEQIEACKKRMDEEQVELLLINDCPEEILEERESELISIYVVNTDRNRGIQGARIRGLELSTGDYVLMIDQDDIISSDYICSQLITIENAEADVSVCKAKENGRYIYNSSNPFERVVDVSYMTGCGNAIVSPGQALIRRDAISDLWKTHVLKHNGADDWFLWICMIAEQRKFVLNDEVLFEHIVNGDNTSWNSEEMLLSERELYNVVKAAGIFEQSILNRMENLIVEEQFRYIHFLEKYRAMFFLYDKWMGLEQEKKSISAFLCEQGCQKIAVYGIGVIGKQLIRKLQNTDVCVVGAIDRNAGYIETDIMVTRLEEFSQKVDLVIVTTIQMPEELLCDIRRKTESPVIGITKLLQNWESGKGLFYG